MSAGTERVLRIATMVSVALVAFYLTTGRVTLSSDAPPDGLPRYQPQHAVGPQEWVMVFIGASICRASNRADMAHIVDELKRELQAEAARRGLSFRALGVSIDREVSRGARFLDGFGPFETISAGSGWQNELAWRYTSGRFAGPRSTPQVILIERRVDTDHRPETIVAENLIMRQVGYIALDRWARAAAPVPTSGAKGAGLAGDGARAP